MGMRVVCDGENGLLNLRAATVINGDDFLAQLRWMIHPWIGLPLSHFKVWAHRAVADGSKQEMANLDGWTLIETVGLPVDESWSDTRYSLANQGPPDKPVPPVEAALARLGQGAPRQGWPPPIVDGKELGPWVKPKDDSFLAQLRSGPVMDGLHRMLHDQPAPLLHAEYTHAVQSADPSALLPHLLLHDTVGRIDGNERPRGAWHPLGMMALSAGSDPLAALALGFGTSVKTNGPMDTLYMVSVLHELAPGITIEFADLAFAPAAAPVARPQALATRRSLVTRPQAIDGPVLDTIAVSWARPPAQPPMLPDGRKASAPVSYAVARSGLTPSGILLTARPPDVGGWLAYMPGLSRDDDHVVFNDHVFRTSDGTSGGRPLAVPATTTYAAAAQDLFGQWSEWEQAPSPGVAEEAQAPLIRSVHVDGSGALVVDFGWDWSDRSPEFIELAGAWMHDPDRAVAIARIDFGGAAEGHAGPANIVPLAANMAPSPSWGAAQDAPGHDPGARFYRWQTTVTPDFAGLRWREFGVRARGQRHLHHIADAGNPDFGTSAFIPPVVTRIWSDQKPAAPSVPPLEAPLWASLPDAAGTSRFTLAWPSVPGADGYLVYEATESSLLGALQPDAVLDTAAAHTARLAAVRALNIPGARSSFRRINTQAVAQAASQLQFEVQLPRGSKVMHFYAITSVSENRIESDFPADSKQFVAVAVPRLEVPPAPAIAVRIAPEQPGQVVVGIDTNRGQGARIEIYRTDVASAAADLGSMGPALAAIDAPGRSASFVDTTVAAGWERHWYRAVCWSVRDDLQGLVEARSASSPAASVIVPPPAAPEIHGLVANLPLSKENKSLISWRCEAPRRKTPLGPHLAVVEARAEGMTVPKFSFRQPLHEITAVGSDEELAAVDKGIFVASEIGSLVTYLAWVPHTADEKFTLSVKVIDPAGRIGRAEIDVSPLDPSQRLVTIPPWATRKEVENGDSMGMNVLSAHELGLVAQFQTTRQEGFDHEQVVSITPPAGTMVPAGSTVTVLINLLG